MIKLQLPPTIRLAKTSEVPGNEDAIRKIEEAHKKNKIVEGYRLLPNNQDSFPYKFFAEININNDTLWTLFKSLMMSMPEQQCFITAHKDTEDNKVTYGEYTDKYALYNKIEKYEHQLVIDGFLKFGTIHQTDSLLEEVFVQTPKYVQYWGSDEKRFRDKMHDQFSIYEIEGIEFIDNFPMVTTVLEEKNGILPTKKLLEILREDI